MNEAQNETTTEQSMSDIANNLEMPAKEQSQTEAQQVDNVGDFQKFVNQSNEESKALKDQVAQLTKNQESLLNEQRQELANKKIESAVNHINGDVGGDNEMAELWLEKQYRNNPELKKIWANQDANPEALNKALDLLKPDWMSKNQTVTDSQIAENQRAFQNGQKTGGTVQVQDKSSELSNMNDNDFMRSMRSLQN